MMLAGEETPIRSEGEALWGGGWGIHRTSHRAAAGGGGGAYVHARGCVGGQLLVFQNINNELILSATLENIEEHLFWNKKLHSRPTMR